MVTIKEEPVGKFTFVPVWVIQDLIVYLMAILSVVYIVKKEKHPEIVLVEFASFVLLNAAVYENFATLMGWYGYGRSLIMIFNVPLSVPVFEYLVVYHSLRLLETTGIPGWVKPFVVGLFGMLADFSLDPVSVQQVFATAEATIGRWTWFIGPGDVNIFGEPVYNFTGWVLLCGWSAATLLAGRYWYARSGGKPAVGYLYPPLAMLAALALICSPLSKFLLWLAPFFGRGSFAEWIMLGFFIVFPTVLLFVYLLKGKVKSGLSLRQDYPVFLMLCGFHAVNILFAVGGKYWKVIPLQAAAAAVQCSLVAAVHLRGRLLFRKHTARNE